MTDLNPDQMVFAKMSEDEVPELGSPRKRVAFTLQGEVFEAPPAVPAIVFMNYAKKFEKLMGADLADADMETQFGAMTDLLQLILKPESYKRYADRLDNADNPIELIEVQRTVMYLMERYGMRPTGPSSDFSTPSSDPESGTSSTDGTQPEESIPATFLSTAS